MKGEYKPVVSSGAQFLEQMRRAEAFRVRYHALLVAAGAEWDGMDGYDVSSLPPGKTRELWRLAANGEFDE